MSTGLHLFLTDPRIVFPVWLSVSMLGGGRTLGEFEADDHTYCALLSDCWCPLEECGLMVSSFDPSMQLGQIHVPDCPSTVHISGHRHDPADADHFEFPICHRFSKGGWSGMFVSLPLPITIPDEWVPSAMLRRGLSQDSFN